MATYNFNDLIQHLIKDKGFDDATVQASIEELEKSDIWKDLAAYLEAERSKIGHYPIQQGDFTGNSLFKYLNSRIDLDHADNPDSQYSFTQILENLKNSHVAEDGSLITGDNNYPWNESLTAALTYYIRFFTADGLATGAERQATEFNDTNPLSLKNTHGTIPAPEGSGLKNEGKGGFRVKSILRGNAGYSFENAPWVNPNFNVDAKTYDEVRGKDEIYEALTSDSEMQFTNEGGDLYHYIRLLMPKYLRRVEVEDLDRNFWVIGQILAALSAYVFDPDSPLNKEFKKILNELIQLWENVLYLWVLFGLISQEQEQKKIYTDIHAEFVYVPEDEWRSFLKYDSFDTAAARQVATKKFQYLVDSYSESNLVIVPIVRQGNYYRNWYSKEFISHCLIYNRNTETWSQIELKDGTGSYPFSVDIEDGDYQDDIGAIREVEEGVFNFVYPYGLVNHKYKKEIEKYYGIVRLVPTELNCSFNGINNSIDVSLITVNFYDITTICSTDAGKVPRLLETISFTGLNTSGQPKWTRNSDLLSNLSDETGVKPNKGFYMGELASYFRNTQLKEYNGELVTIPSAPIRKNADQSAINVQGETFFIPDDTDWPQVDTVISQIKQSNIDKNILEKSVAYDKAHPTSTFLKDLFKIYVTNRVVNIDQDPDKNPWQYKYVENNELVNKNTIVGISFGNSLDSSAILYNSETDSIIEYNDYKFLHVPGYWAYKYPAGIGAYGWSSNVAQIWTKGDKIDTDNWCIKFVQATGVYDKRDSNNQIKYYDVDRNEQVLESTQWTNRNQWNNYNSSVAICSYVQITLFYWDGTTAYKIYDRWGKNDSGQECLFLRENSSWARDNDFNEQLISGKYWLTKKSNNYDELDPAINFGWNLFNKQWLMEKAPAGINEQNEKIYGLGDYWDFSKNPNNGYCK